MLQEVCDARIEMQRRTNEWYQGLRSTSSDEEEFPQQGAKMKGVAVMETSFRGLKERQKSPCSSAGSLDITDTKNSADASWETKAKHFALP